MKEGLMHCTNEQLQTLLDGQATGSDRAAIETHLQQCAACAAAYQSLRRLDQGLRRLPVEAASSQLTRKVMGAIVPSGRLPIAFRIVENLAYVFAVLIVTGIMVTIFIATGVIDSGQVSEGQSVISAYMSSTGDWLAEALRGGSIWLERYVPASGATNIAMFTIVTLGVLVLLDRVLHRRFQQRTR